MRYTATGFDLFEVDVLMENTTIPTFFTKFLSYLDNISSIGLFFLSITKRE